MSHDGQQDDWVPEDAEAEDSAGVILTAEAPQTAYGVPITGLSERDED